MREKRRLILTERQTTLARIAQREAMMSLAATLDEEAKSASLAERSKAMATEYGHRSVTGVAADLRELSALASGLASLANDAAAARDDARQQAAWQVENLAETEARLKRLEGRSAEARRALREAAEARRQPVPTGMARKMHGRDFKHSRTRK